MENTRNFTDEDILVMEHLADMAKAYVFNLPGEKVPDGNYSDADCAMWEICVRLIREGRRHNG